MRMRPLDPLRAVAFVLWMAGMATIHVTVGWWATPWIATGGIPGWMRRWLGWPP